MQLSISSILLLALLAVSPTGDVRAADARPKVSTMAHPLDLQVKALAEAVRGKRVGLITNPTGVDGNFTPLADVLVADGQTTITAFFSPEHGLRGDQQAGGSVNDYIDPYTGVPVYSLYGSRKGPTDEQLARVDVLVFDIQDAGARFYTFVWTMTHGMEAASRVRKPFIVFDRPNPVGLLKVQGAPNTVDEGLIGRKWPTAPWGLAVRHGMTAGEIATLANEEWLGAKADLRVVKVPGYKRSMTFAETNYPWVLPSPNMPTTETALVYPGTCIFEGSNLSEGRGTTKPFELIGAPFLNGKEYAEALNAAKLPGVRFRPLYFTPAFSKFQGQLCGGVQVHVTDPETIDPVVVGLTMLKTAAAMRPESVTITPWAGRLMGIPNLETRIRSESVEALAKDWQANLDAFKAVRAKHLLYE